MSISVVVTWREAPVGSCANDCLNSRRGISSTGATPAPDCASSAADSGASSPSAPPPAASDASKVARNKAQALPMAREKVGPRWHRALPQNLSRRADHFFSTVNHSGHNRARARRVLVEQEATSNASARRPPSQFSLHVGLAASPDRSLRWPWPRPRSRQRCSAVPARSAAPPARPAPPDPPCCRRAWPGRSIPGASSRTGSTTSSTTTPCAIWSASTSSRRPPTASPTTRTSRGSTTTPTR